MFESEEQKKRVELIITLLAKLYVVLELSIDGCLVCHKSLTHDLECPIPLPGLYYLKTNNATPATPSAPSPSASAPTNPSPTRWSTSLSCSSRKSCNPVYNFFFTPLAARATLNCEILKWEVHRNGYKGSTTTSKP